MCAARAQSSLLQSVAPMVGESMTAPTLRTWGSFAAQKGELAPPLSLWRRPLRPPGTSQTNQDRETHHHHRSLCHPQLHPQPQPKSPLHLQEAMRSPSIATQLLHVAAASLHRRMATRSRFCDGIEAVPEQNSRSAQLCHKGTSYLHIWQMAQPTGRDRRQQGPVHKQ